jgi:uncharacterized protein
MNDTLPDDESETIRTVRVLPPGPGIFEALGWLVALLVIQVVACVIVILAGTVLTGDSWLGLPSLACATTTTVLSSIVLLGFKYGSSTWEKLAIHSPGMKRLTCVFFMALSLGLLAGEVGEWLAEALLWIGMPEEFIKITGFSDSFDEIQQLNPLMGSLVSIVFVGLFPAIGEELFFRGFIGRGLVARWGRFWGVLVTSILFGAMHMQPLHVIIATLIGLVLHAVYLWTGSLIAPMLLHMTLNCESVFLEVLARNNHFQLPAGNHLPPALAVTALLATAGLGLLLYRSRVRWVLADGTDWAPTFTTVQPPPVSVTAHLEARPFGIVRPVIICFYYLLFIAVLGWEFSR